MFSAVVPMKQYSKISKQIQGVSAAMSQYIGGVPLQSPTLHTPFSPSLIVRLMITEVSVHVKHYAAIPTYSGALFFKSPCTLK